MVTGFSGDVFYNPANPRPAFAFGMGYRTTAGPIPTTIASDTFYRFQTTNAGSGCYNYNNVTLGFTDPFIPPIAITWDLHVNNFTDRVLQFIDIVDTPSNSTGARHQIAYRQPAVQIVLPATPSLPDAGLLDPATWPPSSVTYTIFWPGGTTSSSLSGFPTFTNAAFSTTVCPGSLTPVMNSTAPDPTKLLVIPVTVTFGETVSGFTANDIVPGNATVTNFVQVDNNGTYSFNLTANGPGLVTADIEAGAAQDVNGNPSIAAVRFQRLFDNVSPTVTVNQASGQSDPATAAPINFTAIFSEPVSGFSSACVAPGGTAAPTTAAVTAIAPNNGTANNIALSGMTRPGTVTAAVLDGCANDAAGNRNFGSSSSDNTVTFNPPAPLVVKSFSVVFGPSGIFNMTGSTRDRLPWNITGIQVVFSNAIKSANVNSLAGVTATSLTGIGTTTLTWSINPLSLGSVNVSVLATGSNRVMDASNNTLAASFNQSIKSLWADVNDDGEVNVTDLVLVNTGREGAYSIFNDLNGDGTVDTRDAAIAHSRMHTKLP
jgi:hypothetical protein